MMFTTLTQLDIDAVRQLVADVLSLPDDCVATKPSAAEPLPDNILIALGFVNSQPSGREYTFDGDREMECISVSRLTTVSITAYGNEAWRVIENLASVLTSSYATEKLKRAGAAISSISSIRTASDSDDRARDTQAHIDVILSHLHRIEAHVNRAKTVDLFLTGE